MLDKRGPGLTKVSKVKSHSDWELLDSGHAPDKIGNDRADDAADFGRRRVTEGVIDARRHQSGVRSLWYPVVCDLHRFFMAIARVASNEDDSGRLVFGLLGLCPQKKKKHEGVRTFALLPGPPPL